MGRVGRGGDKVGLEVLDVEWAGWRMGIAMGYTGNEEHSKDMLHDCFVKIFESVSRFEYKGAGSLKAWISRIVVNTALSLLQKQDKFLSIDEYGMESRDENQNIDDNEQIALYETVTDEVILERIANLPARLRVIFNMHIFDEMPHSDIARQLNLTETASRVRLHRAKTILASELKDYIKRKER